MTGSQGNWLAVACAQHVVRGRELGIMQVCHGKGAPLKRIRAGDRVVYYSPTMFMGGREKCQRFTALGEARDERVYQADMGGGFHPFRRDVDWRPAVEASIHPLLPRLDFSRDNPNWGYALRFGLIKISKRDMDEISAAMSLLADASADL